MKNGTFLTLTLVLIGVATVAPANDVLTISCLVAGNPGGGAPEVELIKAEFAADSSQLALKPRNGDGSCTPQTIRSNRFSDEKKFSSLRISLHRCGPEDPYFYANAMIGSQKLALTSFVDGLNRGVALISQLTENETIATPYGPMESIRMFCKKKSDTNTQR